MRRVASADGTRIALHESGDPAAPVLLCLHGYPDDAALWEAVAAELAADFRVIAYDVRGAGESDRPAGRAAYRLERLEEDFAAVLAEVGPERQVHLLAHDWGSIQAWHFVTSAQFRGRVASFVSISGPSLDHAGFFLRDRLRQRRGELLRQLLASWYILFFQLPWLPELAWRLTSRGNPRVLADHLYGLQLYRTNIGRLSRPEPRSTDVPVLVIAPSDDAFVTVALQAEAARWATDLKVRVVRGDHWLPRNDPGLVARLTREHSRRVAGWSA